MQKSLSFLFIDNSQIPRTVFIRCWANIYGMNTRSGKTQWHQVNELLSLHLKLHRLRGLSKMVSTGQPMQMWASRVDQDSEIKKWEKNETWSVFDHGLILNCYKIVINIITYNNYILVNF